jgi:uncharacterized membrane protein YcaP (DUF421 family)
MSPIARNLLVVAGSTLTIYLFLSIAMRLVSRRQMGQITALDLLIIILLGSAVETAMVHGDVSIKAGIVSATTLFLTNYLISRLIRSSKRFGRLCGAGPVLVVHDGKIIEEQLKRFGITHDDLLHAIRQREHADLSDVRFAVLEQDGQINVVARTHRQD